MIWGICIGIFSIQFLIAVYLQWKGSQLKIPNSEYTLNGVSVIIPFHNESECINQLISSLNDFKMPENVEFIFVDDHSIDRTKELMDRHLNLVNSIITNEGEKGKKQAIRVGVEQAKFDSILTWDADISVPSDFFDNLFRLPKASMIVLPVKMKSAKLLGKLAIVEFEFLKTLGFGSAAARKPILANGANLLFSKSDFLEVDQHRTDYDMASGDDLFLLKAMKRNGKEIITINHPNLAVETEAPSKILPLVRQRQRWFGKMSRLFDLTTIVALLLLIAVQVAAMFCLARGATEPLFFLPITLKFFAEAISVRNFLLEKPGHWLVLFIHQFWYPLYILLSIIPVRKEEKWT